MQNVKSYSLFVSVDLLLLQLQRSSPQAGPGQRRPTGRRDQCYVQGIVPTHSTLHCVLCTVCGSYEQPSVFQTICGSYEAFTGAPLV